MSADLLNFTEPRGVRFVDGGDVELLAECWCCCCSLFCCCSCAVRAARLASDEEIKWLRCTSNFALQQRDESATEYEMQLSTMDQREIKLYSCITSESRAANGSIIPGTCKKLYIIILYYTQPLQLSSQNPIHQYLSLTCP